jgi:hypothetical protein
MVRISPAPHARLDRLLVVVTLLLGASSAPPASAFAASMGRRCRRGGATAFAFSSPPTGRTRATTTTTTTTTVSAGSRAPSEPRRRRAGSTSDRRDDDDDDDYDDDEIMMGDGVVYPRPSSLGPPGRRRRDAEEEGGRVEGWTPTPPRPSSFAPLVAAIASSLLLLASSPGSAAAKSIAGVVSVSVAASSAPSSSPTYHLARILFLRLLALVYISAFSVAKFQNRGLIGDAGISPARDVLDRSEGRGAARSALRREWLGGQEGERRRRRRRGVVGPLLARCWYGLLECAPISAFRDRFWYRTDSVDRPLISLLWLARDRSNLNPWLDGLANAGLALSATMLAAGCANVPIIFGMWLVQRSLMSVGGTFYGYGWEPQLAELTFHAMFLVPMSRMDPFLGPGSSGAVVGAGVGTMGAYPVPTLVVLAIRFYLFKIMLGAGLIKLKSSDAKWKPGNMSAMDYFYETQVSIIPSYAPLTVFGSPFPLKQNAFLSLLMIDHLSFHCRTSSSPHLSTARTKSIHAILSFQPETVAQIRGLEQSLRGARGPVPPVASIPLHETRGWCDSDYVSVDTYFEWKPEVNSPRVCYYFHLVFFFVSSNYVFSLFSFLNWLTIVSGELDVYAIH